MKVDITDLVRLNKASMDIEFNEALEGFPASEGDIRLNKPVRFTGTLVNLRGTLRLEGRLKAGYRAKCSRCLADVAGEIDVWVKEDFISISAPVEDKDEVYTYEGSFLEIDKALVDNIVLHTPMKLICREGCRGLCPKCGTNLNEGGCSCKDDAVNPQMEALKDYLRKH